ncbi:mobilome CxxCx(11)CxxC protein [Cupriavidus sp. 8B]
MTKQNLEQQCLEKEIYAYGTAFLFEGRARGLRYCLRILSFLSLAVPLSVGGIAMTFSDPVRLSTVVKVSGGLSIPLFVMTLWSLVFRWEERLAASEHSRRVNTELKNSWEDLRRFKGRDAEERFKTLLEADRKQEQKDIGQDVSAKDRRRMMRASLIQYQRACATCRVQPASMSVWRRAKCATCG